MTQKGRTIFFVVAVLVTIFVIIGLTPPHYVVVTDSWDGPLLVIAGLLWILAMIANAHYLIVTELRERMDRAQDEISDQVDQVALVRNILTEIHQDTAAQSVHRRRQHGPDRPGRGTGEGGDGENTPGPSTGGRPVA